ncbi:MAG: D-alanine--D-alanine ligase [Oscillospiraceae bacterium]|nr:D-alanine--D-alanine ligase [Oscillospiraceae bacterium]
MEKTGKITVLCLFGGNSTEYEVSCRSFNSVAGNIDEEKFNTVKVGITKSGEWNIYTGSNENIRDLSWINDSENLFPCAIIPRSKTNKKACLCKFTNKKINMDGESFDKINIDVILPIVHGANGEDGSIQGLAKMYEIPCAGSDIIGSVCSFDKVIMKVLCAEIDGINMANYIAFKKYEFDKYPEEIIGRAIEKLKFPMFIKPANAGSSVGIFKVKEQDGKNGVRQAILDAFTYDSKIIIEENINGKEIEVAVIGNDDNLIVSCPGEIKPNAEFYDYDTKYITDTSEKFIPAEIEEETSEKIRELAKKVYMTVGAGGFSRVDFFLGENNKIYFNETNSIPGFTDISMFAKLMMYNENITYKEVVTQIIELALEK